MVGRTGMKATSAGRICIQRDTQGRAWTQNST